MNNKLRFKSSFSYLYAKTLLVCFMFAFAFLWQNHCDFPLSSLTRRAAYTKKIVGILGSRRRGSMASQEAEACGLRRSKRNCFTLDVRAVAAGAQDCRRVGGVGGGGAGSAAVVVEIAGGDLRQRRQRAASRDIKRASKSKRPQSPLAADETTTTLPQPPPLLASFGGRPATLTPLSDADTNEGPNDSSTITSAASRSSEEVRFLLCSACRLFSRFN